MIRTPFPGGYHIDGLPLPDAAHIVMYPGPEDGKPETYGRDGHFVTHNGRVEFPAGERFGVMSLAISQNGTKFAGLMHDLGRVYEYDGTWHRRESATAPIYRGDELIDYPVVLPNGAGISAHGWRYVADDGSLVSEQAVYDPYLEISQRVEHAGIILGQGHFEGGIIVVVDGVRRVLDTGDCDPPKFRIRGDQCVVCYFKNTVGACAVYLTLAEFRTLDVAGAAPPPPIIPAPVPVPPPQPEPKPMTYRSQNEILPYLQRRWTELGVPAKVDAVKATYGIFTDEQMTALRKRAEAGDADARRLHDAAETDFRNAQSPAFFRAIGELYWGAGMKDVGLGRKTSGANVGGLATDIIVLKPLEGAGQVQLIDAMIANGYPEGRPGWGVIEFNPDRTWIEPPQVNGVPTVPPVELPPRPLPVDLSDVLARLANQDAHIADLTSRVDALEAKPAPTVTLPKLKVITDPNAPALSTGSRFGHSHSINLKVVPE